MSDTAPSSEDPLDHLSKMLDRAMEVLMDVGERVGQNLKGALESGAQEVTHFGRVGPTTTVYSGLMRQTISMMQLKLRVIDRREK